MNPEDQVENIFFIKSGAVRVFDKNYNPLLDYKEHDFFGEYQILLDLYAGCFFRTYIPGAIGATSQNQH